MNEKIKELLTPLLLKWGGDSGDNFSEELNKFAESIVRECIETLGTHEDYWSHEQSMNELKRHFGIE